MSTLPPPPPKGTVHFWPSSAFQLTVMMGAAFTVRRRIQLRIGEALKEADRLSDDPVRPKASNAWVAALRGDENLATRLLGELFETQAHKAPFDIVPAFVALERYDDAFELLEDAYTNRDPNIMLLKF